MDIPETRHPINVERPGPYMGNVTMCPAAHQVRSAVRGRIRLVLQRAHCIFFPTNIDAARFVYPSTLLTTFYKKERDALEARFAQNSTVLLLYSTVNL
jgi:hypothetical protein